MDRDGNVLAYDKPLIVLIDEFSTSAGDIFPSMMQDNHRGPLAGWRTNGAGGSISVWPTGTYSEALASNTNSLVLRRHPVATPDFPVSRYIENVGARPDIEIDYMTRENLLGGGAKFFQDFTGAIVNHIRSTRPEP
jgi:C-terminal processing protease CtpA/Prc